MSTPHKNRASSARANLVVIVGSALYFLVLGLALYVMDRQVYSAAKLEIIRDNFLEIFRLPDNLNEQARTVLYGTNPAITAKEKERLRQNFEAIVNGPTSMMHMSLVDADGKVLLDVDNPDKARAMNTWDNNLFIRRFSGRTSQNVSPQRTSDAPPPARLGHITGVYTSPQGVAGITQLTARYRLYAAALTFAWVLVWMLIYYYLLRPARNLTYHLDLSRKSLPSLIPAPRGTLESGYNDLAASALLQLLEEKLNASARPDATGHTPSRAAAVEEALALAGNAFGATALRAGVLGNAAAHPADALETYDWRSPAQPAPPPFPTFACPADPSQSIVTDYENRAGFTWHAPLAEGCLQVDCHFGPGNGRSRQNREYLLRTCQALQAGFVTFQAYREQLFRERSEANISLSRNMGHDLTNIIATSKLELMGIKRILETQPADTPLPPPRATILAEGVRGLLESTRLMQEMVNIYRSFSYVKKPAYERRPLPALLEEFLATFEPALSTRVTIQRHYADDLPAPIVEPRLLKLALFNVLQNALDAIKRSTTSAAQAGQINISVVHIPEDNRFEIRIADTGPGLRDADGQPLSPADAQRIFEYGYTTKGEGGEGLGLNWVRTIMAEFHDGGVRAENRSEGGAIITLWLHSMERNEARVGQPQQPPQKAQI